MPDISKTCVTCGSEFVLTEGAQEFYKKNELQEPKRCARCRAERRKKCDEMAADIRKNAPDAPSPRALWKPRAQTKRGSR
jgi:hypothetical protein